MKNKTHINQKLIYLLVLAIIALLAGLMVHLKLESVRNDNDRLQQEYEDSLFQFEDNNLYYDPQATIDWLSLRQHPKGYFVANPDVMDEPSQLNKNSLQATRHAVLTLNRLDGLDRIDQVMVLDFVLGLYREDVLKNGYQYAGFASAQGESLGLRPTMDAVLILVRLGLIEQSKINLQKVKNFLMAHQNSDGGFWDPYYSSTDTRSCLKCTSFALTALGTVNSELGEEFSPEFINKVSNFIDSTWDEHNQSYAPYPGGSAVDSFDVFRAFLSLSILPNASLDKKIEFSAERFRLEPQLETLAKNFTTDGNIFTIKINSNQPSMKATHLLLWVYSDLKLMDQIDTKAITRFVLNNQTSPGEYGGDIYNTYSATSILKRLNVATSPLEAPTMPKAISSNIPALSPYLLYILSFFFLASYYLNYKKQLDKQSIILEDIAYKDNLTGLYNREYLEEAFDYHRGSGVYLSLIFIDVDHFKDINDNHGHLVGDNILQELSTSISKNIRTTDILVRWGGEEFVILCPSTRSEAAEQLAEKLQTVINQQEFAHIGNCTCSFGITSSLDGDDIENMLDRADKAMYLSKKNGRNRITVS